MPDARHLWRHSAYPYRAARARTSRDSSGASSAKLTDRVPERTLRFTSCGADRRTASTRSSRSVCPTFERISSTSSVRRSSRRNRQYRPPAAPYCSIRWFHVTQWAAHRSTSRRCANVSGLNTRAKWRVAARPDGGRRSANFAARTKARSVSIRRKKRMLANELITASGWRTRWTTSVSLGRCPRCGAAIHEASPSHAPKSVGGASRAGVNTASCPHGQPSCVRISEANCVPDRPVPTTTNRIVTTAPSYSAHRSAARCG